MLHQQGLENLQNSPQYDPQFTLRKKTRTFVSLCNKTVVVVMIGCIIIESLEQRVQIRVGLVHMFFTCMASSNAKAPRSLHYHAVLQAPFLLACTKDGIRYKTFAFSSWLLLNVHVAK